MRLTSNKFLWRCLLEPTRIERSSSSRDNEGHRDTETTDGHCGTTRRGDYLNSDFPQTQA